MYRELEIKISTPEELELLRTEIQPSGKFILTADIDMKGRIWQPAANFYDMFDGNGHTIRNLHIIAKPGAENDYYGLFARIVNFGAVKNLTLEDCVIDGGAFGICGGIAGIVMYGSFINNCKCLRGLVKGLICGAIAGQVFDGDLTGCNAVRTELKGYTTGEFAGEFW
ncbi:MAG: hypothetical protein LBH05_08405 [Deferribacteraceae bacterium]|jgi:hypothetical protein|nr:hypothetical protein [Deferribacteraceae bacterium]